MNPSTSSLERNSVWYPSVRSLFLTDNILHAFRIDDVFVREAISKRHRDDEIDGWEIGLAEICVMSKPTHIKTVLLIWDALVISAHKSPMREIDVCFIEAFPFLSFLEMGFELIKYILLQECPQKILSINRINEKRWYLVPLPRDGKTHADWMGIHKTWWPHWENTQSFRRFSHLYGNPLP